MTSLLMQNAMPTSYTEGNVVMHVHNLVRSPESAYVKRQTLWARIYHERITGAAKNALVLLNVPTLRKENDLT